MRQVALLADPGKRKPAGHDRIAFDMERALKAKRAISLYTGAGGLDLGFEAAGFDTRVAVEIDLDAVATLRHNRSWPVLDRDIHSISSAELLKAGRLKEGEADIVIGGPPCQPFSKSGYWATGDAKRLDDPRSGTLGAYLRVLRDTLPKSFLLENVPGLAFSGKAEGLHLIEQTVEAINKERGVNYDLRVAKLNSAWFGVPQLRERVFVIASREGRPFVFPSATHAAGGADGLLPFATAWDAIGDLNNAHDPGLKVRGKWADLLPTIPEGENYLFHTDRGGGLALFGWRRRYWSFLLKLAKSLPSWTVQAQPGPAIGPFHWDSRRLSMRELCRLQTFPNNFEVLGTIGQAQKQIGNAVPSALAEVLARAITNQFLGGKLDPAPTLAPNPKLPVPPPEAVKKVPRKFNALIGDHEAHPGTGKGHKASLRER